MTPGTVTDQSPAPRQAGANALRRAIQGVLPRLVQLMRPNLTMPAEGPFHPIDTSFDNPDTTLYAGRIHLLVRADCEDALLRVLDVRVESPSGRSHASAGYALMGTKVEIIRTLEQQLAEPTIIEQAVRQAARLLADSGKA